MEHAKIGAVSNLMNRNFYFAILLLHVPTRRAISWKPPLGSTSTLHYDTDALSSTYTYNNKAFKTLYELILQARVHWPSATTNNELRLKHVSISWCVADYWFMWKRRRVLFLILKYILCRLSRLSYIPFFTYLLMFHNKDNGSTKTFVCYLIPTRWNDHIAKIAC